MNLKILVTDTRSWNEAYKFCQTITDNDWRKIAGKENDISSSYWHYEVDNETIVQLLVPPDANRFDFIWELAHESYWEGYSLACIVMLDSSRTEKFRETAGQFFTVLALCSAPTVIAVTNQDKEGAWDSEALRIVLRIPPEIPIIPCVATDKKSVANVLIALCEEVLRQMEAEEVGRE